MEKSFLLNPSFNLLEIKDAMNDRFSKIKGILNCLIFALEFVQGDDELDHNSAFHALWAIDGFLDELCCLKEKLDAVVN